MTTSSTAFTTPTVFDSLGEMRQHDELLRSAGVESMVRWVVADIWLQNGWVIVGYYRGKQGDCSLLVKGSAE